MKTTKNALLTVFKMPFFWGIVLMISVSACSNKNEDKRYRTLHDLEEFVKARRDSAEKYSDKTWNELDKEFREKKADLDRGYDKMDKEMKAAYEKVQRDWDSLQYEFDQLIKERSYKLREDELSKALAMPEIKADFSDLEASQVLHEYEYFVNTVKRNKDIYNRDDWEIIGDRWEMLNNRKDQLDKQISKKDNKRIMELKVEYNAIKVVNKPLTSS